MQLVNDSDETITLAPGEALTFDSTVRKFEDVPYRVTINGHTTVLDADGLTSPFGDFDAPDGGGEA